MNTPNLTNILVVNAVTNLVGQFIKSVAPKGFDVLLSVMIVGNNHNNTITFQFEALKIKAPSLVITAAELDLDAEKATAIDDEGKRVSLGPHLSKTLVSARWLTWAFEVITAAGGEPELPDDAKLDSLSAEKAFQAPTPPPMGVVLSN